MAIVVEDGTGKADAEAYVSVAEFKDYCDKWGLDYTGQTDPQIEVLLRKATNYMVTLFRASWQGCRVAQGQALDWPRYDVELEGYAFASNAIPAEVTAACCELAHIANTTPLLPTVSKRGLKSVKIGPLAVSYDGDGNSAPAFVQAVRRLAPLLTAAASGNTVGLVRC